MTEDQPFEPESRLARVRRIAGTVVLDFGGMLAFYLLLWTVGLKAAIGGTIVFVVVDGVRRHFRQLGFPKIYILTTVLVIVFGGIDLMSKNPFMLKYEAVITNLVIMLFFLAGLRGKPLVQEVAEQQRGEKFDGPQTRRFFQIFTLLWAVYFLLRAGFDLWTGLTMPLGRAMAVRQVVGLVSLGGMFLLGTQGEKLFRLCSRWGLLPAVLPTGVGADR